MYLCKRKKDNPVVLIFKENADGRQKRKGIKTFASLHGPGPPPFSWFLTLIFLIFIAQNINFINSQLENINISGRHY